MSPWAEFNQVAIDKVPECLAVFLLGRGEGNVAFVGRADENLRKSLSEYIGKGYTHFRYVRVPWLKEGFEMQCRLYHHEGGRRRLDNTEHPQGPTTKMSLCEVSAQTIGMCDY